MYIVYISVCAWNIYPCMIYPLFLFFSHQHSSFVPIASRSIHRYAGGNNLSISHRYCRRSPSIHLAVLLFSFVNSLSSYVFALSWELLHPFNDDNSNTQPTYMDGWMIGCL